MSIREWIRELEIGGTPTFSFSSVRRFFPNIAEQSIKNDLFRLSTQKIIVPVYRGFYVIMPPNMRQKVLFLLYTTLTNSCLIWISPII